MEPKTLADFFSRFSGTVAPETRKRTTQPSLYNQLIYRFDLPKKQDLRKPNPRTLVKLRLMLKYKSQREIAKDIGVSPTNLSYYTNNRGKVAGWDDMDAKIESYGALPIDEQNWVPDIQNVFHALYYEK